MSVWLTPDGKPFFGGTYFPPDSRYGRPGFVAVLEYIAQAWLTDRARIVQSGEEMLAEMRKLGEVRATATPWLDDSIVESCANVFRRMYDSRLGGFGGAPKFPRPVTHDFLLRHGKRFGKQESTDMVLHTLREMARGGMYDQMGGGFHRYSVDDRWFVPHFEKMLYDQGQLAVSYLEAYQITGENEFAAVARDIFDYVLRDMTHPQGGFYSAEDADSVSDPAHPHEKGEGAFYIWAWDELERELGPTAEWFAYRYGVEQNGNVENDPQNEFSGRNILYQRYSIEETAGHFGVSESEVSLAMAAARTKLMAARARRVRPHLDDKVLTGWNGMMISALALGGRALGEEKYLAAARRAADFLLEHLRRDVLLRRFRDGDAAIPGFLDDYALFAHSLADLYEASFEPRYLDEAAKLATEMVARFEDPEAGAFFSAAPGGEQLVLQLKDDYDGAEPSGNSTAIGVLFRLAAMLGRDDFRQAAERGLRAFAPRLRAAPHSLPRMLVGYLWSTGKAREIVLAGDNDSPGMREMRAATGRRFLPETVLLRSSAAHLPPTASMTAVDGKATAYVCENFTCQLPVSSVSELEALLQ